MQFICYKFIGLQFGCNIFAENVMSKLDKLLFILFFLFVFLILFLNN